MQPATQAWWFAAGRLLGTVVLGLGIGWMFSSPWAGLACALIIHLAFQLVNLFRLEWWLRHRSYADAPDSAESGVRSSRRSCVFTVASASTNSASCNSFASYNARPRHFPTAWSSSTDSVRSSGLTGWRAAFSTAAHRRPGTPHRKSPARARVRPLLGRTGLFEPCRHPSDYRGRLLPFIAGRPLRRWPTAVAR